MVVLGQLFSFRCQYHRLLDSHANEKLLLGLEEVAQEFESLFGRIASRLNKLNTKAQTKLLDLVAQSAFQPVMNCLGDFGDEINLILEIIVDYRYCLEFFESGTLRTQHNVQLAEQDGDNDHQREIELEEELNRANYYQAGLQTSIDSLQADLNRFRGDNNNLNQEIQDLQNQNQNLQALVEEIQTNFNQLEELSGKRQQEIKELEQKLSSANASKESLEQSLREVNEK
jgi:DNA repair exonuclease SbcCD ATPase subunit